MSAGHAVKHPYFPQDTHLPHYKANVNSISELLGLFFGLVAVVIVVLWLITKHKSTGVRIKICWFVSCGFIHSILEGYFSLYHATLAGEQTFLAQMWKEYGKGDSRYIASDTCMVAMESITAFIDGPLCFMTAAALFFKQGAKYRYVLQFAVSICQLYGDTIFFFTEIIDDFKHSEMWHPLHFWFYFFFLNIIWIIVPSINILDAFSSLCNAQAAADKSSPPKTRNTKKYR